MNEPIHFDEPWKDALERHLHDFLRFAFPNIAAVIDPSVDPVFLDTEFQPLLRDSDAGPCHADKLARVHARDGSHRLLLVHVEVQSQPDPLFARRMFRYRTRIAEHFDEPVSSLAILGDECPDWRPDCYEDCSPGNRVFFQFAVCKLLDLEAAAMAGVPKGDPAAVVIAAHRAAQRTRHRVEERAAVKGHLLRILLKAGLDQGHADGLFRFVDWLLSVPEEVEMDIRRELREELRRSDAMKYETPWEKKCRQEGRMEGRQEGQRAGCVDSTMAFLEARFGSVPSSIADALRSVDDPEEWRQIMRMAATAPDLNRFASALRPSTSVA